VQAMFRLKAEHVMPRKNEVQAQIHVAAKGPCTSIAKTTFASNPDGALVSIRYPGFGQGDLSSNAHHGALPLSRRVFITLLP
jgi:hypothetical protein